MTAFVHIYKYYLKRANQRRKIISSNNEVITGNIVEDKLIIERVQNYKNVCN